MADAIISKDDLFGDDGHLSLYLDLRPGQKADLEIVAEAALKWASSLKAAARHITPGSDLRIEFVDATEGSVRLNAILEWTESQLDRLHRGYTKYPRLEKAAAGLALFTVVTAIPTIDHYFGDVELTQEDRSRLDVLIEQTRRPDVEARSKEFFRTVERDPAITGVGVTASRDKRPRLVIPSSRFTEFSGLWDLQSDEADGRTRDRFVEVDVILTRAALVGKPSSWKFQPTDGLPEFSAKMADQRFLQALSEDGIRESLRIGIRMRLLLKIREKSAGGVWLPDKRTVVAVLDPKPGRP